MLRWSEEQLQEFTKKRSDEVAKQEMVIAKTKFRNTKTKVGDLTFDSKLEAGRYAQLVRLQELGQIFNLELQAKFVLMVNRSLICKYIADFVYIDLDGNRIVEDAKGVRTREYILKKKLMKALHGIDIKEFRAPSRAKKKIP